MHFLSRLDSNTIFAFSLVAVGRNSVNLLWLFLINAVNILFHSNREALHQVKVS